MKHALWVLALLAVPAIAELPPPTPQEKAKLEKESAAKAEMEKREKAALAKTQERIASEYRGGKPAPVQEPVGKSDVPKSATQPIGKPAEPHEGRKPNPQAESHSQSAD